MAFTSLTITREAKTATVTLNRPDTRNAFNEETIGELTAAFVELGADEDLRAIVLAANGPAFCAGADLNWMKKMAGYTHAENHAGRALHQRFDDDGGDLVGLFDEQA
ncbi:MAG: enoyl-CoA hydratase-related protein, partial [Duganella sp.]